ncbi:unnamed protein product [Heligmosomoides polygyrus]|uniref:Reverse transcriptase domain-containing protein n=1 Tax=Heligmosomoides polygyrus TaxID=6339 RepID=A0A183FTM1_HELPZ|nr:unnamed protein product [Heligmosomoides polygyrus]
MRHRQTQDIEKFFNDENDDDENDHLLIDDENDHLLIDRKRGFKRWRGYFEEISTVDFPHPAILSKAPTHDPMQKITVEETEAALKKMKPGKATGLTTWQLTYGSPSTGTLLEAKFPSNQCGFVADGDTTDVIHAARLLLEKHHEKQKPAHIALFDLEIAFDRVLREVIWYALRYHGVPEVLIESPSFGPCSMLMLASEDNGEPEREVQACSVNVNGIEFPRTSVYKYLGSAAASDGKLMVEVNSRIPEHLKSKIYRAVVRPVAMYGVEFWPVTKEVETRLSVLETKMLRWTAAVMRMDRIQNDAIRQRFSVAPIGDRCAKLAYGVRPRSA